MILSSVSVIAEVPVDGPIKFAPPACAGGSCSSAPAVPASHSVGAKDLKLGPPADKFPKSADSSGSAPLETACDQENLAADAGADSTEGLTTFETIVPPETCGYNQGCKLVAEKFKKYWKKCMADCCDEGKVSATTNKGKATAELKGCEAIITFESSNPAEDIIKKVVDKCKKDSQEQAFCNKKASGSSDDIDEKKNTDPADLAEKANYLGRQEVNKFQEPGRIPDGASMTVEQGADCAKVVASRLFNGLDSAAKSKLSSAGISDLARLSNEQLSELAKKSPGLFNSIGKYYAPDGFTQKQQQAILDSNPKAYLEYLKGASTSGVVVDQTIMQRLETMTNAGIPDALSVSPRRASPVAGGDPSAVSPELVSDSRPPGSSASGLSERSQPSAAPRSDGTESAQIQASATKDAAKTAADGQSSAAMIGALAMVAAALIPVLLKQDGGSQGGSTGTTLASNSGATVQAEQLPTQSTVNITEKCLSVITLTEAELKTCQAYGFRLNGAVITPQPEINFTNNNPQGANSSVNLLHTVSNGDTIEQVIATQPGASVETIIGPGGGSAFLTSSATTSPIRITDIATEGTFIGDFRTNLMIKYPSKSTADKPPLKEFFAGTQFWPDAKPWPAYQFQGIPAVTLNYQVGAPDPANPNTVNVGVVKPSLIKVIANIPDLRLDFKATNSIISAVIQDHIFRGSSMAVAASNVGTSARKNYILEPKSGTSYLVTGQSIRIASTGKSMGKVIQSSAGTPKESLTAKQCEMVYGYPCQ